MSDRPHRALNEGSVGVIEAALVELGVTDGATLQSADRRNTQYHVGDIVRLQSGGPRLTVLRVVVRPKDEFADETEWVSFAWHTADGLLHTSELPAAALRQDAARLTRRRRRR